MEDALASLGLRDLRRIVGGWQSIAVYAAEVDGRRAAVKVLDPTETSRTVLDTRVDVLATLGATTDLVCAPIPVGGRLVNEVAAGYVVAYELAEGDPPDTASPDDSGHMGRLLAELHLAMAALPRVDLPVLATTEGPQPLVHGDFGAHNMRVAGRRWRVFDFDDCGYGPVELDVAYALYFVLFADRERYPRFREAFLAGYQERSGAALDDAVLDGLITRRVMALSSWLEHPETAPPGIRGASDEWRRTLEGFVEGYFKG